MTQITRTTPLRWMTLHLSQIFFTDARTFITQLSAVSFQPSAKSFKAYLLIAINDSSAIQVVRRKLHRDFVAGQDANKVFAHLAGDMRQYLVLVLEFHFEHGVRQRFQNHGHHFNRVFFAHAPLKAFSYRLSAISFSLKAES